jgi:type II secretory pathway component GspD/PulD (secretin)
MKKLVPTLMLVGIVGLTAVHAQTDTNVTSAPAAVTNAPAAVPAAVVIEPTVAPATNVVDAAPAPAPAPDAATATATASAPAEAVSTNPAPAVAAAAVETAPAAPASGTNAVAATPAPAAPTSIPLIQFSDVPIRTAIENLARQANINYMLDPKIGYGEPDAQGQIKPEPQLSIRWENISAENALLALLDNYNLQLNRDKKTGIDRITMKDPTAPPPLITRVVQLQYASVSNMVDAVAPALSDKRSKVLADSRTSQMIVVATEGEQAAVDVLVKQLDKPTRQVLIETKLVEVSSQPSTKKGVDWSSTLSGQNVTFGNGNTTGSRDITRNKGSTTLGPGTVDTEESKNDVTLSQILGKGGFSASTMAGLVPYTAFLNADGLNATISFLNNTYNAQIMSTPKIVTLDNEMANIEVTRQFPIINVGAGTQNASGSSSVTYSNIGTILHVTPRISANDKIWLRVLPEVSSHFGDQKVSVPGGNGNPGFTFTVPIFDVRRLATQVLIPNGNTLVMGGMVKDNPTSSYIKVPILGDIPGLGWGFRSENKSMEKDNLLIFLTPTIVQDDDFTPHQDDFLKQKVKPMQQSMKPNTWWDSGEARGNWDSPVPVQGEYDQKALHNF